MCVMLAATLLFSAVVDNATGDVEDSMTTNEGKPKVYHYRWRSLAKQGDNALDSVLPSVRRSVHPSVHPSIRPSVSALSILIPDPSLLPV